jgi:DNA damage-binding protein 1
MCFLEKTKGIPTIAVLYQDNKDLKHIKTYQIDIESKTLKDGTYQQSNIEFETKFITSPPFGGILIFGEYSIYYQNEEIKKSYKFEKPSSTTCFSKIDKDGYRWLLGDLEGNLRILGLKMEDDENKELQMEMETIGIVIFIFK